MENENITLTLTVNEVNTVLGALQELPYRVSNQLIQKVQAQGQTQLAQAQAQAESEEKAPEAE